MWICGVDIPPALIDAHKSGTLVLFVGAGASMSPPSSLPNFEGLVERIRDESSLTAAIGDVKNGPLDEILGRMEDRHGVPVHARIACHISDPGSRPNETHQAIVRLASAGQPRIVTTNYDEHISTLAPSVPRYFAPALPMGDNFSGLIYLHGAISQGADALIATDRDFGRAYLKDAWAARFLERMFSKYTVLFIGYSHNDVIMKYLARGLGRADDRFILTPDPASPLWKQLGIAPIAYPTPGGSHDALRIALDGWASEASMRLLDHRERIKSIVANQVPPLTPENRSYLESVLAEEDMVKYFSEFARDPAWLWWAAGRPEFQVLFQQDAATNNAGSQRLATWFAQHFVTEEQSGTALAVLRASGGRLGPVLAYEVGRRLHGLSKPLPAQLRPWLLLGMRDAPPQGRIFFNFILSSTLWTEDHDASIYLFMHLTEPEPNLVPGLFDDTRLEVGLRGEDHWLRETWQNVYLPNLPDAGAELLSIVDYQLRKAHLDLAIAEGAGANRWPSGSRTGIEPNPGDEFPSPLGFLIDASRDCIESLLKPITDQALTQLGLWASSDLPLLRRLAIHGWIVRQDKPANEKLSWLREHGWLLDSDLNHEVFRLLTATLPDADEPTAAAIVGDLVAGADADPYTLRRASRLLNLIMERCAHPVSARDALEALLAEHAELSPPEHGDGRAAPGPDEITLVPTTPDDLHEQLDDKPAAVRGLLIQYEAKRDQFDAHQWYRMSTLLREVVQRWPEDGFKVLDLLGAGHPEVARYVIYGWAGAHLESDVAERVLDRLETLELGDVLDAVTRMLGGFRSTDDEDSTNWRSIPRSRNLATLCWNTMPPDTASAITGSDWVSQAINHPAGHLAEFWVQAVEHEWGVNQDTWNGLPPDVMQHLEMMLGSNDMRSEMAQVLFASYIPFLYEADPSWCEQNLLPLLKWDDVARAERAWDGFLYHGQWTERLLSVGLLDLMFETLEHGEHLAEQQRLRLLGQFATLAIGGLEEPLPWLQGFTTRATVTDRAKWAEQVAHYLRDAPAELVERQWERWMRSYWQNRLAGVPREMTVEEATAMTEWVLYLTDSLLDGIAMALQHELAPVDHTLFLHVLSQESRVARAPEQFASLITHFLAGANKPFFSGYDLPQIVDQLKAVGVPEDLIRPIEEQAERLDVPHTR